MEYLTKDFLLRKLINLETDNYKIIAELIDSNKINEPENYHNELLEIYGQLSKENIIKLLKLKPKSDNFMDASADIF